MTKTILPSPDYLFCKKVEKETQTSSGIFLTEQKNAAIPSFAEVINVGGNIKGYEAGDEIIYREFTASEVEMNDTYYLLVEKSDVIGKVLEVKGDGNPEA